MKTKNLGMIEKTFLFIWPFLIVFSLVTYLIAKSFYPVVSFLLGAFTSLLLNSLHYRVMKQALLSEKKLAKTTTVFLYIGKMIFFGVVLYFVIINENWNIWLTFVGLLSYRIVFYPVVFFEMRKKEGDGNAEL
ncbi:MAG TPA: hypothetical protein PLH02_06045 [Bacillota bacterium]|nr:hypothetical protein [Bacillota bacterium]HPJ86266.1 hypothetical protein [Bacillota bacterium]HPQ62405.1 hypothetical protein [Bacillota bacterium]HRX91968.1 hypothetical protein [Candidatus Izemoplasmatales bacterium]